MKVYILEDEVNIREYILSLAGDIPYLQVVGCAAEITTAQKEIQQLQPDLILADIELKDGTCFTLFNTIKTDAHIIFITAYNQYAIDALNLGAFAYLLKPVDTAAFNNTIDRCYKKIEAYRLTKQQLEITDSHYQKKDTPRRIVLKNFDFIQIVATSVCAIRGGEPSPHVAAVQITTDNTVFGGLSGASVATECISWGKESPDGDNVMVFADVTIALPLLCQGLSEHYGPAHRRRRGVSTDGDLIALLEER